MIRSPESFAGAFASAATADLLRPGLVRRRPSPGELEREIRRDIADEVRGVKGPARFPNIRRFVRTWMGVEEARAAGLSSDVSAISDLISMAVNSATKYYTTKVTTEAQTKIAEYQTQSALLAQQALNLQAQNQALTMAAAEGAPQAAIRSTVTGAAAGGASGGFPVVPVVVGAGVLGLLGVYFLVRRR